MRIISGIDLPVSTICGSMSLVEDLYANRGLVGTSNEVNFFCLEDGLRVPKEREWMDRLPVSKRHFMDTAYREDLKSRVKSLVDSSPTDAVHCHHLTYAMTSVLLGLSDEWSIPSIAFCHGTDLLEARSDIRHRQCVVDTLERATSIIFPSLPMLEEALGLCPSAKYKFHLVPWGVCRPDSNDRDFNLRARILYAGRLDSNKDVRTIIDAVLYSDFFISLCIVGEGPSRLELESHVYAARLDNRVFFSDFMDRRSLWALFDSFDCLVISSREIEAFGLICAEAQAHGLPVIYSATPGLLSVIGESGLHFEPGDVADLKSKIQLLFERPDLRRELSFRGFENARRFDIVGLSSIVDSITRTSLESQDDQ